MILARQPTMVVIMGKVTMWWACRMALQISMKHTKMDAMPSTDSIQPASSTSVEG